MANDFRNLTAPGSQPPKVSTTNEQTVAVRERIRNLLNLPQALVLTWQSRNMSEVDDFFRKQSHVHQHGEKGAAINFKVIGILRDNIPRNKNKKKLKNATSQDGNQNKEIFQTQWQRKFIKQMSAQRLTKHLSFNTTYQQDGSVHGYGVTGVTYRLDKKNRCSSSRDFMSTYVEISERAL